ncbi:TraB/GumN family protein, partial [Caulobacter sp. 17J65-9]|uniref:TraB/GumN family protein n=1 Tax=Caulobacter sp. 17J65-9 TaxID=2709382 RepID=UPI0013C82F34|nr:TraB/GumN family protein [Caulobacter sp. 17J65-9]
MIVRSLAALAAVLMLSAGPAAAQTLEDPDATVVEDLIVKGRLPGPAWWKVSDGDSTVYILGVPDGPLPPGTTWDHAVLENRLKGAHTLIEGVSVAAGLRDVPALLKMRKQLRSDTPMEASLPADLRARFVSARERAGRPADRYAEWIPLVAGVRLASDLRGRGWADVEPQVRKAAKKAKAKVRGAARYEAVPMAKRVLANLTPAVQQECLTAILDDLEAGDAPARRAAEGWARGDVAAAIGAPRRSDRCL